MKTLMNHGNKRSLDGNDLRTMFTVASRMLESNMESLNSINVFPVADGDTGTNILLTMRAATEAGDKVKSGSAEKVADALAKGALMGAKGNSGVILSQFFRGIALTIQGKQMITVVDLAAALAKARELAYQAVSNPIEGTILTVIDRVAKAAQEVASEKMTFAEFFSKICDVAKQAVQQTPDALPILRKAGVIDAGGQALFLIIESLYFYLRDGYQAALAEAQNETAVPEKHVDISEQKELGFCTNFMVTGENLNVAAIREKLSALGTSAVIVGDENLVKVHLHTENPDQILKLAQTYGAVSHVQVDDMEVQHHKYMDHAIHAQALLVVTRDPVLFEILENSEVQALLLGPSFSLEQLRRKLNALHAEEILLLITERDVAKIHHELELFKNIQLLNFKNIPQALTAAIIFNAEDTLAANQAAINLAWSKLRVVEIFDTGKEFRVHLQQQLLGKFNSFADTMQAILEQVKIGSNELATLYCGEQISQSEIEQAKALLQQRYPSLELEISNMKNCDSYLTFAIE